MTRTFLRRGLWFLGTAVALSAQDTIPVRDLTLAAAHALALNNQPRFAIAQLQTAIAQENVRAARSTFLPAVNAYVSGVRAGNENTRILAGGLNNPSIYDRLAGGLAVSQLLTDFGRTGNLSASAKLQAQAQMQNTAATREQVLLNVDIAYYDTLEAAAVLRVAQQTLATRQLLVNQMSALSRSQLRSDLDVSFAQVAFEEAQVLVQKAEGQEGIAQAALGAALGFHDPQQFKLEDAAAPPEAVADYSVLLNTALRERPEILSLRDERDAAARFARAEKDLSYPTVSAVGAVGDAPDHDVHLASHYAAGGVQLSVPLFAGGLDSARQHAAELKRQIATQNLRDAEDNVVRDVRAAWLNFKTAATELQTTDQLVKHANEAFTLAQARYKIGSSSIIELSQAQLEATSAQIEHADALYAMLIQHSLLDYQVGTLR